MMRTLVRAIPCCLAVTLLASQSACFFGDPSGRVAVSWELRTPDGAPAGCLPGEEVHIVAVGYRFVFPCEYGAATTGPLPTGDYNVTVELYALDGPPIIVNRPASIWSRSITDLGHIVFGVQGAAPLTGSATFYWDLYQYSFDSPPEGCQPGETLYFEITGVAPFVVDCYLYGSQPVTDLPPGRYEAYVALEYDGVLQDDPRPGYGYTELTVVFDVFAGLDTPVQLDFVVQAGPARGRERTTARPPAPAVSAARPRISLDR
jgi:hypothetical protein